MTNLPPWVTWCIFDGLSEILTANLR